MNPPPIQFSHNIIGMKCTDASDAHENSGAWICQRAYTVWVSLKLRDMRSLLSLGSNKVYYRYRSNGLLSWLLIKTQKQKIKLMQPEYIYMNLFLIWYQYKSIPPNSAQDCKVPSTKSYEEMTTLLGSLISCFIASILSPRQVTDVSSQFISKHRKDTLHKMTKSKADMLETTYKMQIMYKEAQSQLIPNIVPMWRDIQFNIPWVGVHTDVIKRIRSSQPEEEAMNI